jgi:hypothetical protein
MESLPDGLLLNKFWINSSFLFAVKLLLSALMIKICQFVKISQFKFNEIAYRVIKSSFQCKPRSKDFN